MIKAVPKSMTSGDFDLMSGGRQLGSVFLRPWRETGVIRLGEDRYEITKKRWFGLRFRITKNGEDFGWATQSSPLDLSYQIDIDGRATYRVQPIETRGLKRLSVGWDSWGGGEITGQNNIGQPIELRLPEEVPPEDQAAIFCIGHIVWERIQFVGIVSALSVAAAFYYAIYSLVP